MAKTAFKAEAGALGIATYASALAEGEKALLARGQELLNKKLAAKAKAA